MGNKLGLGVRLELDIGLGMELGLGLGLRVGARGRFISMCFISLLKFKPCPSWIFEQKKCISIHN